ncbi:MAG: carbohydrate kinase [Pseudomonadota bacterium]
MILCCGEALIDMLPHGSHSTKRRFEPHPGGAAFNTSIALGRLGVPAAVMAGVSNDMFGAQITDALKASGVSTQALIRSDRPTTLAFVELEDGHARYAFFDENSAGRMITAPEIARVPEATTALLFGGISLVSEPAADAFADLLIAQSGQRLVMLDPNIRPSFVRDEPRYRKRLARLIGHADIIKVSDEDLDWLVPEAAGESAQAQRLLNAGAAVVLVTRGAKGAAAYRADSKVLTVAPPPVAVVDTIGAGDAFNAGILAALAHLFADRPILMPDISTHHLSQCMTFACQVAAHSVTKPGASPPWISELPAGTLMT